MVVMVAKGGKKPDRAGSGRSIEGTQREAPGGGWFPGTVERVREAEVSLTGRRFEVARKETGIPRGLSRREGSHWAERPGAQGGNEAEIHRRGVSGWNWVYSALPVEKSNMAGVDDRCREQRA